MEFNDYQYEASKTAVYPDIGSNISYPVLGLAGEAGEICNKVKKIFRDAGGIITNEKREDLSTEVGDVLWYVAALCQELNIEMDDVAQYNLKKLNKRKEKGTLKGEGDDR